MKKYLLFLFVLILFSCYNILNLPKTNILVSSSVPELIVIIYEAKTVSYVGVTNISDEIILSISYSINLKSMLITEVLFPTEHYNFFMFNKYGDKDLIITIDAINIYMP